MALLDSQVAVLANQALNYLVGGKAPTRLGNAHPNIVPYQTFATARMATSSWRWAPTVSSRNIAPSSACRPGEDERFKTNRGRVENRKRSRRCCEGR
jgi:crotonobetainyl-CoA:carnitine CoA-transferase CaiB-like acyl-CoA transferase